MHTSFFSAACSMKHLALFSPSPCRSVNTAVSSLRFLFSRISLHPGMQLTDLFVPVYYLAQSSPTTLRAHILPCLLLCATIWHRDSWNPKADLASKDWGKNYLKLTTGWCFPSSCCLCPYVPVRKSGFPNFTLEY